MELLFDLILSVIFEIVGEVLTHPFRSLFGARTELPNFTPMVYESEDPSKHVERNKRLELYYSRGYW